MTTNNPNIASFLASLQPNQAVTIDGATYQVVSLADDLDNPTVALSNGKRTYRLDPIGQTPNYVALSLRTAGGRGKPVNRLVSSLG